MTTMPMKQTEKNRRRFSDFKINFTHLTLFIISINTVSSVMTGGDGISNCDILCNPDNHYDWSCKTYCPDYSFSPAVSTSTIKPTISGEATLQSDLTLVLLVVFGALFATAFISVAIYIIRKQRRLHKFCPIIYNEQLPIPVQETVIRYENELNEIKEEMQALSENKDDQVVETNSHVDTIPPDTTNPGETVPLLDYNSPSANSLSNTSDGVEASRLGNCNGLNNFNEQRGNHAAVCCRSCIEMNETFGNQRQIPQTENVGSRISDDGSDTALSDDNITVHNDSSDEESIDVVAAGPKRVVRDVTEIEV